MRSLTGAYFSEQPGPTHGNLHVFFFFGGGGGGFPMPCPD